jgi:hypothetical protein
VALVGWAHHGRSGPGDPGGPGGPGASPGPWAPDDPHRTADPAEGLEGLARRYSAGEIDAEKYHRWQGMVRSRTFAGSEIPVMSANNG